ncbi:MAG: TldD/PmbA family protein [Oligoflexia bacterium]|nr:TldD/PmbA family protein [Oligoflexia bacterium]MBF0364506.1 TldD/PmbA family protein [Oligoflexia bacterium]
MLSLNVAQNVLSSALDKGATFADIFVEKNRSLLIKTLNGKVDKLETGTDFGIGVRLIFGTKVLYGITNSCEEHELLTLVNSIALFEKASVCNKPQQRGIPPIPTITRALNQHPSSGGLDSHKSEHSYDYKIERLLQMDQTVQKAHSRISQAQAQLLQRLQNVAIFNSEGLAISDERHYTRLTAFAVASDGKEQTVASKSLGALDGFDYTNHISLDALGEEAARKAVTILNAKLCPAEKMPVILGNGFGGVIFHEACGHLLESAAVEKQASIFTDKMDNIIASPIINAIDDGTIKNAWGSINIDDEGMASSRLELIREGKLVNFMMDLVGHLKTGYARTGSARRESYRFPPAARMRNTFIAPGSHSFEEMITSIDYGLWAKNFGGGSVQPGTGDFNFVVEEGHLIRNGKIAEAVKGATLIGNGAEVLKNISMVGCDLDSGVGICGSVSGSVPVTVGQPSLKVDAIVVGGRG